MVETCSVTAADCSCRVFPYIERTGQDFRPAVGGLFSFRQYDAGTGLCCPLAAAFSLSAKDTFQRPPATRWTGIFQNFFCFCNVENRILATGGQRIFPFTPYNTGISQLDGKTGIFRFVLYYGQKSKMPNAGAKKFPFHLLLQSEQGKMAGNGAGQQKKQQIFFRLTASCAAMGQRLFSCKIKEGGSTLGYRPLGYTFAKTGGAVNGGRSPFTCR